MLIRYSALTALVVVVALATGYVVHRVAGTTTYEAACQFELSLPATAATTVVASSDVLAYNRRFAADELYRTPTGPLIAGASKATGIPAGRIAAAQQVAPLTDSSFSVGITYANGRDAVRLANALCDQYVAQLASQVDAKYGGEALQLRGQLAYLLAQAAALDRSVHGKPTALYLEERDAIRQSLERAKQFLAVTYSSPHFSVSVLQRATGASAHSTKPSVSKSLIVAAAVGLLVSFLIILVTETVRGRNEELAVP